MSCEGYIMKMAKENHDFRRILQTNDAMQVGLMRIDKGTHIGMEKHAHSSQFFFIVEGNGILTLAGQKTKIKPGMAFMVSPGTSHDVRATTKKGLGLYTIYSPPVHEDGLVQRENPLPVKVKKPMSPARKKAAIEALARARAARMGGATAAASAKSSSKAASKSKSPAKAKPASKGGAKTSSPPKAKISPKTKTPAPKVCVQAPSPRKGAAKKPATPAPKRGKK